MLDKVTLPFRLLLLKLGIQLRPISVLRDVQYGMTSEENADLYIINDGKYHPAVVLIHGGGWQGGDKNLYKGTAAKYNAAGFHAIAINYRLANATEPSKRWPAQLEDCQLAIRWIRSVADLYKINRNQIVANGGSAGGHLSVMLGVRETIATNTPRSTWHAQFSSKVCGVLDWAGPADLTTPHMRSLATIDNVFGPYNEPVYREASTVTYVNSSSAPICMIHGINDDVVQYDQSLRLQQQLIKHGVKHKLISFNGGHDLSKLSLLELESLEYEGMLKLIEYAGA